MKRLLRIGTAVCVVTAVSWQSADRAVACDPWPVTMLMLRTTSPGDANAYTRGDLGVVQPTYMRRFLVQAYRRFAGVAPNGPDPTTTLPPRYAGPSETVAAWLKARTSVEAGPVSASYQVRTWRPTSNTEFIDNCLGDAFLVAARTLEARVREFGASHPAVLDWLRAQDVVFNNCPGDHDAEPAPAPPSLPEIFKKDRDYQIAAAHFYAMHYAEAEQRFTAIASDPSSPWQPYGTYLAARAMARRASLAAPDATERAQFFRRADERFATVAAGTSPIAKSADDLRSFLATHADPVARLHAVALTLATAASASDQDFIDFSALFDKVVDSQVRYAYNAVRRPVGPGDDLTDWILALQGDGRSAAARALERWNATHSVAWLVAALWRVGPDDPQAPALLKEAAQLPRESPAAATVSFLRVRLLTARGDRPAARELLGALPDSAAAGFPPDAINLIRAQRFQLAQTFEESMRTAPRLPVAEIWSGSVDDAEQHPPYTKPVFDIDAARLFSEGLPMSRLLDAASSSLLPERLRAFVAAATWVRAVQLRDDRTGLAAASQLTALTPALADDMRRYTTARDAESRHRAGLLTLLNWPGLRNYVRLTESAESYGGEWPARDVSDGTPQNWWCGFEKNHHFKLRGPYEERPVTPLMALLNTPLSDPVPSFLAAAERQAVQSEIAQLTTLGPAPNYFTTEALAWAAASPKDDDAAQALARAVRSTKYGCGNDATGELSRRAFTVLHKHFPASEWAKRTPFWYYGWGERWSVRR